MASRLSIFALSAAAVSSHRIIGDATQSLNSVDGATWSVSNGTSTVSASIPGDLITDLAQGGIVPKDPLYELNFTGNAWDACNWTYSTTFTLDADVSAAASISLVLDGIKMVSDLSLNGVYLGFTADQFLRYTFDLTSAVKRAGANTLTVTFPTGGDARNIEQRWASCSGGWCVRARPPTSSGRPPTPL
jgi:beta-galactosidase/beta-glucuronidase